MTKNFCEQCGTALPTPGGSCPRCLMALGERPAPSPSPSPSPSSPPSPPPPPPADIAADFPHLEILSLIGRGGMGVVYKARQPGLDRLVALKILPHDCSNDPAFAERFAREARVLARLDHPNIVRVHDAGHTGDRYWLLMEYVDGLNLRQLSADQRVEPRESLSIVTQICDALQYAHDAGVVHRDIKPENILVDRRGTVKIGDFGLAKLLAREPGGVTLTRSDQAMGTPHYMAPEQIRHPLDVDHRADIYSLGVVFYELLTGELPMGNFPLPSDRAGVDARLDEVVLKSLEREPERRYQRAGEVRTDVQRASEVAAPTTPPSPEDECAAACRPRRRHRVGCTLAAVGCLVLVLLGGALLLLPVAYLGARQEAASDALERARAAQSQAATRDARERLLQTVRERYAAVESAHVAAYEPREDGGFRLEIRAFPVERQELAKELRAGLEELREEAPTSLRPLLDADRLEKDLLPFGRTYSVIEVFRTDEGWSWSDSADWTEEDPNRIPFETGPELPPGLRRHLPEGARGVLPKEPSGG